MLHTKRNEKQLWWQIYWPKEPYMKKLKTKEFHMYLKLVIKLEHPIHKNHFKENMIVDGQLKCLK